MQNKDEPAVVTAVQARQPSGKIHGRSFGQVIYASKKVVTITIPSNGLNSDIHGGAAYRAHLVTVMAKRALWLLAAKLKQ